MKNRKGIGQYKKNQAQRQRYVEFVSSSSNSPESTVPRQNAMLQGSDEVLHDNQDRGLQGDEIIKKTPLKYRFFDWIKANLLVAIITAIVIGVATTAIKHEIKIAVFSQRIDYIERRIDVIDEEDVTKEYLQLRLDLIKAELDSGYATQNDINEAIKDIESQLGTVENGG